MLPVDSFTGADRPTSLEIAQQRGVEAAREAFAQKLVALDAVTDENGQGFADRLLALIMLNVLDEKWKDHLYDLDQLRASIHYRSWGQKDPLVEYKQDAYSMFVDLMHDIANTFTERFLKAQLVFEQAPPPVEVPRVPDARPTRRFNAMGILEDVAPEETSAIVVEPVEAAPAPARVAALPSVVGAGAVRSVGPGGGALPAGWEETPRNNPCPCGSGKKFKKCHGAAL
jgi:preprotein translocase subunit SecA